MNRRLIMLACTLLLAAPLAQAEIYKWKDASGRIHFGDEPPGKAGAEKLTLQINTYESVSYQTMPATGLPGDVRRDGGVVMYGASWCGYCKRARAYFAAHRIRYVEHDIEKSPRAREDFERFGGRGVPVIFVGNTRINGFSAAGFEAVYGPPRPP